MTPIYNIVKPTTRYIATSQIVEYPFFKQTFTYGEYMNWKMISPRFTMKDYIKYTKQDKTRFVYDICE
mgnify:FL=1